jgi:hypothetical protein
MGEPEMSPNIDNENRAYEHNDMVNEGKHE